MAETTRLNTAGIRLQKILDRYGVTILTLLLCGLLILLITKWTWLFLTPAAPKASNTSTIKLNVNALTDQIVNAHIFGAAGQQPSQAEAQISSLNLHLKGVFAFSPSTPAFAIINTGAKDEPFKVGDQIMTGVKLHEVQPRHIVIDRSGALEKVLLEEKDGDASASIPPPGALPPIIQPPQQAPSPIAGMPVPPSSYSLSRQEIASATQNRNKAINMGRVTPNPTGGISIDDIPGGSIAEKLGLQSGDVIRSINGSPVNSPFDLARLYQQLAPGSQIQIEGMRGTKPINLTYQVRQ